ILLLFDRSSSTQDKWRSMRNAAGRFISNLRPQDRVAVGSFDDGVIMFSGWQESHTAANRALDILLKRGAGGGTNLYWSLERATQREFRDVQGRRAVVVLTDGRDNLLMRQTYATGRPKDFQADPTFQHTREVVSSARVPVYFIAMNTDLNRGTAGVDYEVLETRYNSKTAQAFLTEARRRIEALASISGGRVFFPKKTTDITKIYDQISHDLSAAYTLGYISSQETAHGQNRKIEVRLNRNGFVVRQSRDSYTAP